MPEIPATSPATGERTPPNFVHTVDGNFVDSHGRTLLFRGVNFSGSTKAPAGEPSYLLDGFWESAEAGGNSFISRPLNLDDGSADIHLARLRGWGFNILRYPLTWEALEHEGPYVVTILFSTSPTDGRLSSGIYDYDFMDYTIRVLRKCKEYGFKAYMDPHQDVVSVYSTCRVSLSHHHHENAFLRDPFLPDPLPPSRNAPLGLLTSDLPPLTPSTCSTFHHASLSILAPSSSGLGIVVALGRLIGHLPHVV